MRRWLLIGFGAAAATALIAVIWSRAHAPREDSGLPAPAPPEFEEVKVASQSGEGLILAGQVLDPNGRPVPRAEVFLASSAQADVSTVKCAECGELLLSCRARETGVTVADLLDHGRGFLVPGARTVADAEGRFHFDHLAGVSFTVWGRGSGLGEGVKERAAPGESAELFLPPLRSIAGTVADDRGQPIAGARVHALSRRIPLPHQISTGADGIFELKGLGQGPFYVLAEADGFLPQTALQVEAGPQPVHLVLTRPRALEVIAQKQGVPVAAQILVSADHLTREATSKGGMARFDGLYPDQVTVSASFQDLSALPRIVSLDGPVTRVVMDLERGGKLLFTVIDEKGAPVPNPELTLTTPSGEPVAKRKTRTGELAIFGPLGLGEYAVAAKADGYKDVSLPIGVRAGETPVDLVMNRATVIAGRVLDEYGRPAAGVSILVSPVGESVLADGEGRFSATVPTAGLYDLHAHHSDWGGGELKVTAPAVGVELHLEARATAEVTVSADGRRIEGADAVLWQDKEASFRSDRPSGADGRVLMRGLPPGVYWLAVGHPEYLASERTKVSLAEGETTRLAVSLQPGAKLMGEVVDTEGAPISGASVQVSHHAAEPALTDGRGHFEIHALKPDQTYALEARHPSFEQLEHPSVTPGDEAIRIVLKRRDVYKGRVVSSTGEPIRRFHIDDRDVTSPDGRFELPLSTEGDRILFAVEAVGYEPQMVDRAPEPDLGDITLTVAPAFNGVVHDATGAPASDAVVSCDVCSETVLSGSDGTWALSRPPYAAQIVVSARKGNLSGTTRASLNDTAIEVVLVGTVHLTGRAFNADGTPAAGAELEAINMDRSEPVTLVTGQDGSYGADVPAGSYRFSVGPEHAYTGSAVVLAQVEGSQTQLDLGPAPGSSQLVVHVQPEPGFALWLIQGQVGAAALPALELLRVPYGQMVYQPPSDTVALQGLPPGPYTLIWGSFHIDTPGGPLVRQIDLPGTTEISLLQ